MQEYIGVSILVPLNIILWLRVGFSVGHRRSQAWVAVTLLTVMWAIHLAVFDQTKTAVSTGLNAVVVRGHLSPSVARGQSQHTLCPVVCAPEVAPQDS